MQFVQRSIFFLIILSATGRLSAQSLYHPYDYQFYQKLNSTAYSIETSYHTAIKPFIIDATLRAHYDSLMNTGVDTARKTWVGRKIFNEHLVDVQNDEYTFYLDFIPDFQIGRDFAGGGRTLWLNTRGFEIGGTIGDKFSFYSNGYENQGVFPEYVHEFINEYRVVPGQMTGKVGEKTQDWAYVSARLSYTPVKYLNISLAYDKNFIGDGYRSLLLSDVSSNYTNLKLTGKLGKVHYMSLWAYMKDPLTPTMDRPDDRTVGDRHKWGAFQYVDWNVNNRLSLGLFQSIVWSTRDSEGNPRGFNVDYINPIIFLRPIESAERNSPAKVHLGLNAKYEVLRSMSVYGQFLLGEFTAKEFFSNKGYLHNKWGLQLGLRGFDAFGVRNLNYLAEFNTVRPYTYSHFDPISNYSNYAQPLAHPWGANLREFVSIWNYSAGRFDFSAQGNYGQYGLDAEFTNYGKDIFKSYNDYTSRYGNRIGQGIATDLYYLNGRVAYLLNPKYNLRLELGGTFRREVNSEFRNTAAMVMFGLRASFRNLYYDF